MKKFKFSDIIIIESEKRSRKESTVDSHKEPKDFDELIEMLQSMEEFDFCDCDDSGEVREVLIGGLEEGRYIFYEAGGYVGCTDDVIEAARFIAEGWTY